MIKKSRIVKIPAITIRYENELTISNSIEEFVKKVKDKNSPKTAIELVGKCIQVLRTSDIDEEKKFCERSKIGYDTFLKKIQLECLKYYDKDKIYPPIN